MRAFALFGMALLLSDVALLPSPAEARRTAIDQDIDGNPIEVTLGGYCDLNGDDCDPVSNGLTLPYDVSFGGSAFTNKAFIHGNSILTFGAPIDFAPFVTRINNGEFVSPEEYGPKTLVVSNGQVLDVDPFQSGGFYQSASLSLLGNGDIFAEWFICVTPGVHCHDFAHSITLTPTAGGFQGLFQFYLNDPGSQGPYFYTLGASGTYIEGVPGADGKLGSYTPFGSSFFMPATFRGLTSSVPEPSVWAMLILGFGFVGASMRRRATGVARLRKRPGSL